MKAIFAVAFLALLACANAGLIAAPTVSYATHVNYAAPAVSYAYAPGHAYSYGSWAAPTYGLAGVPLASPYYAPGAYYSYYKK